MTTPVILATIAIAVLSAARTARLLIYDDFPPVAWLRLKFLVLVGPENSWAKIAKCHFCITPWLAAGMAVWVWLAWQGAPYGPHWSWWVINGIWGLSYLAAMAVSYDQPPD